MIMIAVHYAPTFVRMYKKLDPPLKEEVKEKIALFRDSNNHQALKVHKLSGALNDRWSFSVNYKIRIVFRYGSSKNTANLLYVGSHDNVY